MSLEDVGKVPGGDALTSFLRVGHNDNGSEKYVEGFDVRSFGATLDGVSDDWAPIQAAIAAADAVGGDRVLIPGRAAISAGLVSNQGTRLIGSTPGSVSASANPGSGRCGLIAIGGFGGAMMSWIAATPNQFLYGGGCEHLTFDGGTSAAYALRASSVQEMVFDHLVFRRVLTAGLLIDDANGVLSESNHIDRIRFVYGSTAGVQAAHCVQLLGGSSNLVTESHIGKLEGLVFNGYLLYIGNSDANIGEAVHAAVQSGGTGGAVIFKNAAGGGAPGRNNRINWVNGNVVNESAAYGNSIGVFDDEAGVATDNNVGGGLLVEKTVHYTNGAFTDRLAPTVMAASLPTVDPHVVGQLWRNGAVVTVSAG